MAEMTLFPLITNNEGENQMDDAVDNSLSLMQVAIFSDGAAVPNPGRGGYGVVLRFAQHTDELCGGFERTTNNRMELMAVIVGLEALKERSHVLLHSDSEYVVNAINSGAAIQWRDNGWKYTRNGKKRVKNFDLWSRLLVAFEKHDVQMIWVPAHSGVGDNERCDFLAMKGTELANLQVDASYIAPMTS